MMASVRKILPKTIAGQLMLLVTLVLIVAQVINLFILVGENRLRARANVVDTVMDRVVRHVQYLPNRKGGRMPRELPGLRPGDGRFYLSRISHIDNLSQHRVFPDYTKDLIQLLKKNKVDHLSAQLAFAKSQPNSPRLPHKSHRPPPKHQSDRHRPSPPPMPDTQNSDMTNDDLIVSIELKEGVWFNAVIPYVSIESLTPRILFATGALLLITLLSLAFFIRRISRPLTEFAQAADEFGGGSQPGELQEIGPEEVQRAARAFNKMQKRLSRTLETQRTMLRAVGHDLRTPLTSLRIRSEIIPEESQRDKFIQTIDEMTSMTEEILSWAKNASAIEAVAAVDLNALLSSIVDDFSDLGADITLTDSPAVVLTIRRMAIKRAFTNVIDNGLKYGKRVNVKVVDAGSTVNVVIDDEGPGIPDDQIDKALQPFVRLESSRNKETGGTGLGLSIAETIAQSEGIELTLENRQPNGLRVTFCLPKK